ncbi:MAG: deoxyribose-phosphate aldolase [bacterium]|nr:deoxyribose-phosphate aldolase [bacterium]
MKLKDKELAVLMDSTLLDHSSSVSAIENLSVEAVENEFCCVCVYPEQVTVVYDNIFDTNVFAAAAVGFPDGSIPAREKCSQTEFSIQNGADEIDMIMNLGWFFDKKYINVLQDIRAVVDASQSTEMKRKLVSKPVVKVIIETAELREEERRLGLIEGNLIKAASDIAAEAGADFVKTSTGMSPLGGVKENDVSIIRSVVKEELKIKAAGGIKTWDHVLDLLKEGVDRIGTSSAAVIMADFRSSNQS